jgi:hypothetical protein
MPTARTATTIEAPKAAQCERGGFLYQGAFQPLWLPATRAISRHLLL